MYSTSSWNVRMWSYNARVTVMTAWEVWKLGNKRELSSDIYSPIKYLVPSNQGAPSRMASTISRSPASTSPIAQAARCHREADVRNATWARGDNPRRSREEEEEREYKSIKEGPG